MSKNIVHDVPYCTVWDGDILIESTADVDLDTREVFNIKTVDVEGLDICEREYIILNDEEHDVFEEDEVEEPGDFWRK